jgi:hypothetical protein
LPVPSSQLAPLVSLFGRYMQAGPGFPLGLNPQI